MSLATPVIDAVTQNYHPLPADARFGDGHLWQKIDREEGTLEQHYSGMAFAAEAPTTSLLKTAGLIFGGSLFFAGATAYHAGKTAQEAVLCGKGIWERFKLAKGNDSSEKPWAFVQKQESDVYAKTLQSASQMVKSYACWIPFAMLPLPDLINPPTWTPDFLSYVDYIHPLGYLTNTDLGLYVGLGFIAYAMYDPRYPKVFLNKIERWIVAPRESSVESVKKEGNGGSSALDESLDDDEHTASASTSQESKPASVERKMSGIQYRVQELFNFQVPISHYMGWGAVDLEAKRKKDE